VGCGLGEEGLAGCADTQECRRRAGPCPRVGCGTNQNRPSCLAPLKSGSSLARSPIDSAPNKAAIKPRGLLPVMKGEVLNAWCGNPAPAALRGQLVLPSNGEAKVSLCPGLPPRCGAGLAEGGEAPAPLGMPVLPHRCLSFSFFFCRAEVFPDCKPCVRARCLVRVCLPLVALPSAGSGARWNSRSRPGRGAAKGMPSAHLPDASLARRSNSRAI